MPVVSTPFLHVLLLVERSCRADGTPSSRIDPPRVRKSASINEGPANDQHNRCLRHKCCDNSRPGLLPVDRQHIGSNHPHDPVSDTTDR